MAVLSRRAALGAAVASLLAGARAAAAQEAWPSRPIRLIIPFTPAGTTDLVGRLAAELADDGHGDVVVVVGYVDRA